jgi:1-acyl-sn-glycerol-3-phosphate acyltransferase
MKKILIRGFQLFILLVIRLAYLGRVKVDARHTGDVSGPVIIASNHANEMDPFIIACFLPLRTIFKLFPYVFMTANVYYYKWWKPIAFLAGCYPSKPRSETENKSRYGVGRSVKALQEGYSVVMFPEGKRTRERLEAKPGISLILEDQEAPLLLCRINWSGGKGLKRIHLTVEGASANVDIKNPDSIMKAVYKLPLEFGSGVPIEKNRSARLTQP